MERLLPWQKKEAAERMVAKPGGKDYGALSVFDPILYRAGDSFIKITAGILILAPNVDSAVIVR